VTDLFLVSWVLAPLLILVVSLGCGLLVHWASGRTLPKLYLLPIGFAVLMVVSAFSTQWSATAKFAGFAMVVVAMAGLALGWRALLGARPPRELLWPAAAAFAGFAVVAAPMVLAGSPGFTGYTRIVDIGHQFDLAAYLAANGRTPIAHPDSSYSYVASKLLGSGYPGGWQSALGGFARLLGTDLMWIYQPFLAVTSGMGALALYGLLERSIAARAARAVAAAVAIQPNILYAYGIGGGFKELAGASLIALSAAVAPITAPRPGSWRGALPFAVALAGANATFNLAILPWLGVLSACLVAVTLWGATRRLPVVAGWAVVGAITVALSVPAVILGAKLARVVGQAEGASAAGRTLIADLGNLAAPMPVRATAGVWLSQDYRFPHNGAGGLTEPLIVIVLLLAVVGLAIAVRRRDWRLVGVAAASAMALLYYSERTGPWLELKAIAMSGPAVLACAFAGAGALMTLRSRAAAGLGWVAAGVVAAGVLAGNALAYHDIPPSPAERFRDLDRISTRFEGRGPTLYPYFDEVGDYLLRRAGGVGLVDPAPGRQVAPTPEGAARQSGQRWKWDLDELQPKYVQSFALLVLRRGPGQSRPPANFELAERTSFYDVWQKERPARTVLAHQARFAGRPPGASACARFAKQARSASGRKAQVAYAVTPTTVSVRLDRASHPVNWPVDNGGVVPISGGDVNGRLRVRRAGRYDVWLRGAFGRRVTVSIAERAVGALKNRQNYPDQYELVGQIQLAPGARSFLISRPSHNLEPGNGAGSDQFMGPLVLTEVGPPAAVRTAPARAAADICRRHDLDWIELIWATPRRG
jgi:hypothetical protein